MTIGARSLTESLNGSETQQVFIRTVVGPMKTTSVYGIRVVLALYVPTLIDYVELVIYAESGSGSSTMTINQTLTKLNSAHEHRRLEDWLMASEIGVQTIQHTNGTDAMTIDSSGRVLIRRGQPSLLVFLAVAIFRLTTTHSVR